MRIFRFLCIVLFVVGLGVLVYPDVQKQIGTRKQAEEIALFKKERKQFSGLLEEMKAYNERLANGGQRELKDAFSFESHDFDLGQLHLDNDLFGYVKIDKMGIELPLYLGATYDNLQKGAAVLGMTSMPIGGKNTNSVIAAHRGTYTSKMFIDIELLKEHDIVEVINPWETLEYEVVKVGVVEPNKTEAISILPGVDMITLMSCHPFPASTHRYMVYCQRVGSDKIDVPVKMIAFESSQDDIDEEQLLHKIALGVVVGFIGLMILMMIVGKVKKMRS